VVELCETTPTGGDLQDRITSVLVLDVYGLIASRKTRTMQS